MKFTKLSFALMCGRLLFAACDDDDDSSSSSSADDSFEWSIPTYDDDYSSISAWTYHMSWNLANVHDPSVAYYDGYYYMFGPDASYGNAHDGHGHFQGKYSKDLVNWTWCPGIFYDRTRPSWIVEKLTDIRESMGLDPIAEDDISFGYWAPTVRAVTVGGVTKLRMYYAVVIDNYIKTGTSTSSTFDYSWTERAFIGMCESTDPMNGIWEDKGFVTCSSSDKGKDGWARSSSTNYDAYFYFNAIDPSYIVTPEGEHWLIYGSWHSGFAALQLDATTGLPLSEVGDPWGDSAADLEANGYGVRVATRTKSSRWQGSEAPEVVYKDGYYYLFMAYDALDIPYNTRVARATSVTGPYYTISGTDITNNGGDCYPIVTHPYKFKYHSGWVGISHCCIFENAKNADEWFYMSQGRLPAGTNGNSYANAIMMGHVRKIVWCPASATDLDNKWPIALPERYTGVPDWGTITADSLVGKWEHINLSYSYGNQQASEYMYLNADGSVTGALESTWSYDPSTQYLTIGSSVVCVEREVDWEADPRAVTFVYAGIGDKTTTWWGKKVASE